MKPPRHRLTFVVVSAIVSTMLLTRCTTRTEDRTKEASSGAASSEQVAGRGDAARGLALVNQFRDSLPAHSGNALRCTSCHLDNGTRADAMPWLGTAKRYPRYRERPGMEESLARRVNECIARSLAGRMLPEDGRDMRDMLAYIGTLGARERPPDARVIKLAGVVGRGAADYTGQCARCHGAAGQGTGLAPAVWGVDSYSIGAGLARQYSLATFLRNNMPHDKAVTLTDQQAADVAAFVLQQPRQDHPGKERDWPNGDAPADVSYPTTAARKKGKADPPNRPLLPRRVRADSLATTH